VTAAGDLAALRGIARRLSTTDRPIEARSAHAWGSIITSSARQIGRYVEFLRAEASGALPEVEVGEEDGYAGLDAEQAATRYASVVSRLALTASTNAGDLLAERDRFLARIGALNAARNVPTGRGVARVSPDASGAGLVARGARRLSIEAARRLADSGTNRRKVLDAVAAVARDPKLVGLTDLQIAQTTGLRDNSVRPRRVELVDGGWLEPATSSDGKPVTREHYGREHTVWVLTQRAAGTPELWAGSTRA
jgi:hypothetical protein